jgi:hypothetical protein
MNPSVINSPSEMQQRETKGAAGNNEKTKGSGLVDL